MGMRLANGNWSDALADTPSNQAKYGQGSGYTGGYGYNGSTPPATSPPGGGPGAPSKPGGPGAANPGAPAGNSSLNAALGAIQGAGAFGIDGTNFGAASADQQITQMIQALASGNKKAFDTALAQWNAQYGSGTYGAPQDGQKSLAAQQQDFNNAVTAAGLTGLYNGSPTLQGQMDAAQMANNASTLYGWGYDTPSGQAFTAPGQPPAGSSAAAPAASPAPASAAPAAAPNLGTGYFVGTDHRIHVGDPNGSGQAAWGSDPQGTQADASWSVGAQASDPTVFAAPQPAAPAAAPQGGSGSLAPGWNAGANTAPGGGAWGDPSAQYHVGPDGYIYNAQGANTTVKAANGLPAGTTGMGIGSLGNATQAPAAAAAPATVSPPATSVPANGGGFWAPTVAEQQLGLDSLKTAASLQADPFKQQQLLHGLAQGGYSNAIDAVAGRGGMPAFQGLQANGNAASSLGGLASQVNGYAAPMFSNGVDNGSQFGSLFDTGTTSGSDPLQGGGVSTYNAALNAMPNSPNQIVGKAFNAADPATQNFILSGMSAKTGLDQNVIKDSIAKSMPQFTAPSFGLSQV